MKFNSNKITIIVFLSVLFSLTALNMFSKDNEFSDNENRFLKQRPDVSFQNILNGKFTKDYESYLNDQFVFRNMWISNKSNIQLETLKKDINGVYICDDGYMIEKCLEYEFNDRQMLSNIYSVNEFIDFAKENNYNTSVLIAPTSGYILKDKLPEYASNFDQSEKFKILQKEIKDNRFVDVSNDLIKNNDKDIYYKTDHHWTSNGAFYAFQSWCEQTTGNVIHKQDEFKVENVTKKFRGSLYSKVLLNNSSFDEINLYDFKNPVKYTVSFNFDKKVSNTIYDLSKLNEKDKYQVFFGGNYPELKITTENKNGRNIVIFKDSFANSFIPFILNDYENISVIDLRYFKSDLKEYLIENKTTDVLILYNIMNFSNDKNLRKLEIK